jgi:DNA-binding CsgD family transcriptional regulator
MRRAHKPFTRAEKKLALKMQGAGAGRQQIAEALDCSVTTLRRRLPELSRRKPSGVVAREFSDDERKLVGALVSFGIAYADIASLLGVGVTTIKVQFREELANGLTRANASVATALYRNATTNQSVRAQMFWLRSRAGWVDDRRTEESLPPSGPEEDVLRKTIDQLDDAGLVAARVVLEQLGGRSPLSQNGPGPDDPIN